VPDATIDDATDAVLKDEPLPQTPEEHAFQAARKTLDYRDRDGQPIIDQPDDVTSWEQGCRAGVEAFVRLVPAGDPTAFAIEQMWLFLRAVGEQINVLSKAAAEDRRDLARLVEMLDKYKDVLPEPGSFVAKLGHWGARRSFGQPAVGSGG
jgi:hypothetical protein